MNSDKINQGPSGAPVRSLFYGMGYWGYYLSTRQIKNKVLFIPYYFLFMNVNVLKGIGYLKRKKGSGAWEKAKRAEK